MKTSGHPPRSGSVACPGMATGAGDTAGAVPQVRAGSSKPLHVFWWIIFIIHQIWIRLGGSTGGGEAPCGPVVNPPSCRLSTTSAQRSSSVHALHGNCLIARARRVYRLARGSAANLDSKPENDHAKLVLSVNPKSICPATRARIRHCDVKSKAGRPASGRQGDLPTGRRSRCGPAGGSWSADTRSRSGRSRTGPSRHAGG